MIDIYEKYKSKIERELIEDKTNQTLKTYKYSVLIKEPELGYFFVVSSKTELSDEELRQKINEKYNEELEFLNEPQVKSIFKGIHEILHKR